MLQKEFLKEAISNLSMDPAGHRQASAGQTRKRHANLQEKIQGLWSTTSLFYKAIELFEGMLSMVVYSWGVTHDLFLGCDP